MNMPNLIVNYRISTEFLAFFQTTGCCRKAATWSKNIETGSLGGVPRLSLFFRLFLEHLSNCSGVFSIQVGSPFVAECFVVILKVTEVKPACDFLFFLNNSRPTARMISDSLEVEK